MGKNNRRQRIKKEQAKARRRKERNKTTLIEASEPLAPALYLQTNPLANLTDDQRETLIEEIGRNSEKVYQESLAKIIEILQHSDPILLLSILARYELTTSVGHDGIYLDNYDIENFQPHIELCQAIALQIQPGKTQRGLPNPKTIKELKDSLVNFMLSFHYSNSFQNINNNIRDNIDVKRLQFDIKLNTQLVRNWGYYSQMKKISMEIYSPFDEAVAATYGFSISDIIKFFHFLKMQIEESITERNNSLSKLYKLKDKIALIDHYHELIDLSAEKAESFKNNIDIESISFDELFSLIIAQYDMFLAKVYEVVPKYVSDKLEVHESVTQNILDKYSYEWGDLKSYRIENLPLSNPIWTQPIIKTEDAKYFCILPQMFFSFVFPSLDRLLVAINNDGLRRRRSSYLEDKITTIINSRFLKANTVSGIKWKDNNTEYETDIITFIDSYAMIIEAKSGRVTDPALRGAPDRIKKHINEIIIAPNNQSKRFKEKLERLITNPSLTDDLRKKLPVDLNTINKIIRVSISLEDFGSIQSNITQYRDTGWLPKDYEPCPTINLADFETLFDILERPVQIIHYLERRQELENTLQYSADEIDLLGWYIGTLFNVGYIGIDTIFQLTGLSAPLDNYYISKEVGVHVPKPKPKIHPLFSGILEQLEDRKPYRWTETGVILHRFSPDDQKKFAKYVNKLRKKLRKKKTFERNKNIAILVPPKPSEYALCYVFYNNKNADKRNDFIRVGSSNALESEHIKQCLVIAKNLDKDDLNYHFIGVYG